MVFKEEFKDSVIKCFTEIGIDSETIKRFTEDGASLEDLEICTNVLIEFDNKISEIYPEYEGCLPRETFDTVWDFNEPLING